jgi:hypothetical protein
MGCTALLKDGGKEMNSDLKIGHVSPKTECVRMHVSTFNRTRAECISVKCALRSNVKVDIRTHSCINVCVWWGATSRTHASEFVCSPTSTFEHT